MEYYNWHSNIERKALKRITIALVIPCALSFVLSFISIALSIHTNDNKKPMETPEKAVCDNCLVVDAIETLDKWGNAEINDANVLAFMEYIGMEHPHIALAQMKIESAHFKSNLAKNNSNYFGMKHPSKRTSTSLGSKNGYASYKSWAYSVLDYALWQRSYARNLTEKEYLDSLSTYAEDKKYIDKVKKLSKNLEIEN